MTEGTRKLSDKGYVLIRKPDHPLAQRAGWVFEHRVVLFGSIGPGPHPCHWCQTTVDWFALTNFLVVDHLNEVRDDNRIDNLVPSCSGCNTRRTGIYKLRLNECPNGHEYTPQNTRIHKGQRRCRTCHRLRAADYRRRIALAAT